MNPRSRYLIKNVGILAISNFASKILGFLLVPLYTSVLTTTEYGTYDLIVTTVTFLFPITTLNIIDAVMRFIMEAKSTEQSRLNALNTQYTDEYIGNRQVNQIGVVIAIGLKFVFFSIFSSLILITILSHYYPTLKGLYIYISAYYFFLVGSLFLVQIAKGLEYVKDMGIAGVLSTAIAIISNILFLLVFRLGLHGFFLANILSQAFSFFYFFIRLRFYLYVSYVSLKNFKHFQRESNIKYISTLEKQMLTYALPLIVVNVGWIINGAFDKYVVTAMLGVAANGLISVAYKIPAIISTLQGIFTQAWQISAIKEYGTEDTTAFYGNSFMAINTMMSISCSFLILLSRPLAHLLYANDFYVAWQYVPFLLISCVLNSASGFFGPILGAKKDSKSMAWSAVYGIGGNIVMNVVLVYLIGIQGATIATAISSLIIYLVRKRAVGQNIQIRNYKKAVLLTWGLLCLQAVIEIYYENIGTYLMATSSMAAHLTINRLQIFCVFCEFTIMFFVVRLNWFTIKEIMMMTMATVRNRFKSH